MDRYKALKRAGTLRRLPAEEYAAERAKYVAARDELSAITGGDKQAVIVLSIALAGTAIALVVWALG